MNTCPNCAARFGFRAIALAVSPAWITCPECKVRLSGNRFVQVLSVAQTLLIIAVATVSWIFFVVFLNIYRLNADSPLATFLARS